MSDDVEITNHRADATQNESLIGMARMGARRAFGSLQEEVQAEHKEPRCNVLQP
jgi:hypothetical protein